MKWAYKNRPNNAVLFSGSHLPTCQTGFTLQHKPRGAPLKNPHEICTFTNTQIYKPKPHRRLTSPAPSPIKSKTKPNASPKKTTKPWRIPANNSEKNSNYEKPPKQRPILLKTKRRKYTPFCLATKLDKLRLQRTLNAPFFSGLNDIWSMSTLCLCLQFLLINT